MYHNRDKPRRSYRDRRSGLYKKEFLPKEDDGGYLSDTDEIVKAVIAFIKLTPEERATHDATHFFQRCLNKLAYGTITDLKKYLKAVEIHGIY